MGQKLTKGFKEKTCKHRPRIFVLVGYPDWRPIDQSDIDRCKIINSYGYDPFIMVYNRHLKSKSPRKRHLNSFARMVNHTFIWRSLGFEEAWDIYDGSKKGGLNNH